MIQAIKDFLARNSKAPGVMALAVQYPDKSTGFQKCLLEIPDEALENAWRCVTETIPVLKLNQFPTARFRWIYGRAVVHCECRKDGSCLGVFASKENEEINHLELDRLVAEFQSLA
jgi:hypothetical protein